VTCLIHSGEGYNIVELQPDDPLGLGFVLVRIHILFMQKEILNPGLFKFQLQSLCLTGSTCTASSHGGSGSFLIILCQ
jgi:hypothetical protein